jgi:hypothetical protein
MPNWLRLALKLIVFIASLLLSFKAGERIEKERQRPLQMFVDRFTARWLTPSDPKPEEPRKKILQRDEKESATADGKCKCGEECECRKH